MNYLPLSRFMQLCGAALFLALTSACSSLHPVSAPQPSIYSLDNARTVAQAAYPTTTLAKNAPTLIVSPPHAASGFDSQRIIYTRATHQLEYFSHSEWIDTPARMLAPLIVAAIENSGKFRGVVLTPSAAAGELRLDTEIVRLQQEFDTQPSRVRLTLRAILIDNTTRSVLAWREFDESVAATSDGPYGGVVAANQAVQSVLSKLAKLCSETASQWQLTAAAPPKGQ